MSENKDSPLFFERYELKYLIPAEKIAAITDEIKGYCSLDPFSQRSATNDYIVNSLYLDSPSYKFYHWRKQGLGKRFNMRVRCYGDDPKPPFFLEVKCKESGFVKKYRARVQSEIAVKNLVNLGEFDTGSEQSQESDNFDRFMRLFLTHNVEPKIFTQYRRIAYFSEYDDYARITFDRDMRYLGTSEFIAKPAEAMWTNYDTESIFPRGCNTILELKCTSKVPLWMLDVIKKFDLQRVGFSKYANSVNENLGAGNFSTFEQLNSVM